MTASGDFETLYRDAYPRLVSLGALKTGRVDIAQELAQETMIRARDRWVDISTFDAPYAWCRTVMVNLLIDHHRRADAERRAYEQTGLTDSTEPPPASALSTWDELVGRLPGRQRLIVTLYYGDDLGVGQIAQLLDTSNGSVKAALFKARRTLRRHLDDERRDGDDPDA